MTDITHEQMILAFKVRNRHYLRLVQIYSSLICF